VNPISGAKIVFSSGKGGTGKTFVATNVARALQQMGREVSYLDCDVEEPNGHLFLRPDIERQEEIKILTTVGIHENRCTKCGKCAEACTYNAIAVIRDKVLFFPELCHACGACKIVCPVDAIIEDEKSIGTSIHGKSGTILFHSAMLETAAGGMSPRLVREVKKHAGSGINIIDSSPGTACPAAEAVRGVDLVVLVTDPTPFGLNDLKLAVQMTRKIGTEPVVLVNRAGFDDAELREYCREEGLQIIAEIPDDRRIAEVYSTGGLVFEELEQYRDLFKSIASKIEELSRAGKRPRPPLEREKTGKVEAAVNIAQARADAAALPREVVVISGKGGTGKTSIAAAFASLASPITVADCDVDAPDLHLLLRPSVREKGLFRGGFVASIDQSKCTSCGQCYKSCRFEAIEVRVAEGRKRYTVDPMACEGCGVCKLVCRFDAVNLSESINGEWYVSETRMGPLSHAQLGIAEENSGRLVTLVREKASKLAPGGKVIIDGAPGTGCPVIASITGSKYAIVVTEPTVSGIHDMERVLDVTNHFGVPTGVIINKADLNPDMADRIRAVVQAYGVAYLGSIPYDESFTKAQMRGLSIVEFDPDSHMARLIREVWERVNSYLA